MESTERLAKNSSTNFRLEMEESQTSVISNEDEIRDNITAAFQVLPSSPNKYSILKKLNEELQNNESSNHREQLPVSILKSKNMNNGINKDSSSSSLHITLPVKFSPSVIDPAHKRHGILKKRSSLDESEILYRRCRSPDVTFTENNYPEFRPILKNQRRFYTIFIIQLKYTCLFI